MCACAQGALCVSVGESVIFCIVCICHCRLCARTRVCVQEDCALLFSPLSCSRAPLNMSDVLEKDITTGAEREAGSLSSPSPLYITSHWHQSLFIPPSLLSFSVPDSLTCFCTSCPAFYFFLLLIFSSLCFACNPFFFFFLPLPVEDTWRV